MKTPSHEDSPEGLDSSMKENELAWLEKKKAVMQRLSGDKAAPSVNRQDVLSEKKRLAAEVEGLEEEKHLLLRRTKGVETELPRARAKAKELIARCEKQKKGLIRSLARKRGFLNEIQFFENEKESLSKTYVSISQNLEANVVALSKILADIDLSKGEVGVLREEIGMLEGEVSVKFREMDHLNEKVNRGFNELEKLRDKMQGAKRSMNKNYYNMKVE